MEYCERGLSSIMTNEWERRAVLAFAIIGGLWALRFVCDCLFWLYLHIICGNNLSKYGAKRQENRGWALVTGASEGIGYALCKEIATRGMNIVIVSRRESELQKIKTEFKSLFPAVKVEFLAADCSNAIPASEKIVEFIKTINITMVRIYDLSQISLLSCIILAILICKIILCRSCLK